jgi:hypothetical protein
MNFFFAEYICLLSAVITTVRHLSFSLILCRRISMLLSLVAVTTYSREKREKFFNKRKRSSHSFTYISFTVIIIDDSQIILKEQEKTIITTRVISR